MLRNQSLEDAKYRYEMLVRLHDRGLIDDPDLQDLLEEQKRVYWSLQRKKLEEQLRFIS